MKYKQSIMAAHPARQALFLLCLAPLLLFAGCGPAETPVKMARQGCLDCHQVELDPPHQLACTSCHRGEDPAEGQAEAHRGLLAKPAHPEHLEESCGSCHPQAVAAIGTSSHFTLPRTTNLTRAAFGATAPLASYRDTPVVETPQTPLELADDLLRRRCFRCHPASAGDAYPAVGRGTGCAACHLPFADGRLVSHRFAPPGDRQCLSCHYGNYVGFDYYGRFEHDFNREYRTPFLVEASTLRPYGVEFHQLQADVHHLAGMVCIDCHRSDELMTSGGAKPSCLGCHLPATSPTASPPSPPRVSREAAGAVHLGQDGRKRPIPPASHPAHHGERREAIACQSCHAQWAFNDVGKHYLRQDSDDLYDWWALAVQGSLAVERLVGNNTDFTREEWPVMMPDGLNGEERPGIWLKGFTMRRWETVQLGRDGAGRITPLRPVLDIALSWLDEEEVVRFDAVLAKSDHGGLRPYVPHTTGPAGIFAEERITAFLRREEAAKQQAAQPEPGRQ
jgi:hypothetical protein